MVFTRALGFQHQPLSLVAILPDCRPIRDVTQRFKERVGARTQPRIHSLLGRYQVIALIGRGTANNVNGGDRFSR